MEKIPLTYGLPGETIAVMMILNKNTKVKLHKPDGDTDFFDIVAGVLQGETLTPYLFIICQDYVLRISIDLMKENGLHWKSQEADDTPHKLFRARTTLMT